MQLKMHEGVIVKIFDDIIDDMKKKHGFDKGSVPPVEGVEQIHALSTEDLTL